MSTSNKDKKTLVLGASPNPSRYSHRVTSILQDMGYPVIPLGLRKGSIDGLEIETERRAFEDLHTITMYMGAKRQVELYDYLLGLKPKRIIFNPGAENEELERLAQRAGIDTLNACTLVLLSIGTY